MSQKMEEDDRVGSNVADIPCDSPLKPLTEESKNISCVGAPEQGSKTECDGRKVERPSECSPVEVEKPKIKKLCGYLHKLGMKGPLKAWKYRFFSYDDKKCHLTYFRIATDVCPLGSIDVSSATFDVKLEMEEGTFEIRTPNKVFILKAVNSHAMMYWLQQLQIKRWEFCRAETGTNIGTAPSSEMTVRESDPPDASDEFDFLPPVKTPTEVVGLTIAALPAPQESISLQNISLKHPWKEIQNTVRSLCTSKPSAGNSIFHFDKIDEVTEEKTVKENHGLEVITKPVPKLSPSLNFGRKARRQNGIAASSHDLATTEMGTVEKFSSPQHQIKALTRDLESQKKLVTLLHRAIESAQQEKRACDNYLNVPEEKDRLELVRHKVRQMEDLRQRVEVLEKENKEMQQSARLQDIHITELKEHIQMLMEKNCAKQEVILKQTEQLLNQNDTEIVKGNTCVTLQQLWKKIDCLSDDIEAYKTQNRFLNSEILQLTNLWRNAAEKDKVLLMKCSYLEARNCQIESKYLIVLRKLQEALPYLDAEYRGTIKSLVEDALEVNMKDGIDQTSVNFNPISEYDDYGFTIIPKYEVEHLRLLAKIQALEIRSIKLLTQDVVDKSLKTKWDNIEDLAHSGELKNLVRCGIPTEHRKRVWMWLINGRVNIRANHYAQLLKKCENSPHPATQQIELDLHRTLTNNKHFTCPTSEFIHKLRRVLLAFSWHNPTIGYCQGLNRLAAVALLVLEEEESAFCCLVDIVDNIMPADYYSNNLSGSQVDQRVFKDFLSEKLPRLTSHFQQYKIDLSLITFNWFLVVFVDNLVSDILLRVWDAFLYEGTKVIFRYALAIFKYNEEEILKFNEESDIYHYLSFFTKTICDGRRLMNIAFNEMNPFRLKILRNRRAAHKEKLKMEFVELEKMKEEYTKTKEEIKRTELDMVLSEEEEET
ncbi:TBC1 domain family member 2A [Pelobates fuscus]|uniref:TBC1 domain family member 2A n=1 Tax=Pelobates fuscus TaxID=191477 RepID=UPI002FE486CA